MNRKLTYSVITFVILASIVVAGVYIYQKQQYNKNLLTSQDRGLNSTEKDQFNQAITDIQNKLNTEKDSQKRFQLYYQLAGEYYGLGNYQGAKDAYANALKALPDNIAALQGSAQIAELMKDYKGAIDFLKRMITVDPVNKQHYQDEINRITKLMNP